MDAPTGIGKKEQRFGIYGILVAVLFDVLTRFTSGYVVVETERLERIEVMLEESINQDKVNELTERMRGL